MQCDVHRNLQDESGEVPYLLDIQANLLADLQTRVVVPLIRANSFGRKATRLHPEFTIDGEVVVMATHLLAAVRKQSLGNTVGTLSGERATVISAIDVLCSGV
jgi:toxin CcdB